MLKKWSKKQAEQLDELEKKQAQVRGDIIRLRAEMDRVVQKGADADELDQKILSVDYECLRMEMESAREHFHDLGRMVMQLRTERLKNQEALMLQQMESYQANIDYADMERNLDYIASSREVSREERSQFDSLVSEQTHDSPGMIADAEFLRRIAQARMSRTEAREEAQEKQKLSKSDFSCGE